MKYLNASHVVMDTCMKGAGLTRLCHARLSSGFLQFNRHFRLLKAHNESQINISTSCFFFILVISFFPCFFSPFLFFWLRLSRRVIFTDLRGKNELNRKFLLSSSCVFLHSSAFEYFNRVRLLTFFHSPSGQISLVKLHH